MKKVFNACFSALLISMYVISYMGFSVHKCTVENSCKAVIMLGDTSCSAFHHECGDHSECNDTDCPACHHHHSDGTDAESAGVHIHTAPCCSTSIYLVTDSQNGSNSQSDLYPEPLQSTVFNTIPDDFICCSGPCPSGQGFCATASTSGHKGISILSIWRL